MKAVTIENAAILIPNPDHKNFVENGEIIEKGTVLEGNESNIQGLRRGQPFTYRLFNTSNNQIIYLKSIKPMETTEVTLGADSTKTATKVNLIPAETFNKLKLTGLVVGGVAGFLFAKYKKHDMKKAAMYIGVGAAIGYVAAYFIDKKQKATVKPSK